MRIKCVLGFRNFKFVDVNPDDPIYTLLKKLNISDKHAKFIFEGETYTLYSILTFREIGMNSDSRIFINNQGISGGYNKEINIKFIICQNNKILKNIGEKKIELYGLLKLCLLKEISAKFEDDEIRKLPELLSYIMEILKRGYISNEIKKDEIKDVLNKMKGSNIMNFSRYINKSISQTEIDMLLNLLKPNDLSCITDIYNRLLNYNEYIKIFEKDFEKRRRESIFEFTIISLVVIEREDFQNFETERKNCPNRVDKILYHGTGIEPISCILTGYYRKSKDRCYQHGKGVYFTDTLDYSWFYGGEKDNRSNGNKIPNIGETFTLIANATYYYKNGF